MTKIDFQIITPERIVYKELIDQVSIPTKSGEITVLPNHIPLVSILNTGELHIKKDSEEIYLAVFGGYVQIDQGSKVVILADNAERVEEIDIERAEAALKRAEELLKEKKFADDVEFAALSATMERELNRIRLGKRRRRTV